MADLRPVLASSPSSDELGTVLLPLARAAVSSSLQPAKAHSHSSAGSTPAWLLAPGACFVTLQTDGRLHGCIGSIEARRPLRDDVVDNARGAAFRDPRFPKLTAAELDTTRIEVSVLSPTEPVGELPCESAAREALRPRLDGVVFRCGGKRSVLLPQVWATLPEPAAFLDHLKLKAGFPRDFWSPSVTLERFTVTEVHEPGWRHAD